MVVGLAEDEDPVVHAAHVLVLVLVLVFLDGSSDQVLHSAVVVVLLVGFPLDGSEGSQVFQSAVVVVLVDGLPLLEGSSHDPQVEVDVASGFFELGSQLPQVGSG